MDKSSELRVRVAEKITDIPREEWDAVFPSVSEGYNLLKTLDDSKLEQFQFRYIIIYERDLPVAAAPCFIMDFPIDIAVRGSIKRVFNMFKRISSGVFSLRVLMCGIPMGVGRLGLGLDRASVMKKLAGALEEIARNNKAAMVIFKDFTSDWMDTLKPLLKLGFNRIESFPYTDMEIDFKSFDEYMEKLSPASREGLKRKLKKADKLKIGLEIKASLDEEELNQVYALYMQTYNKQEMGLEKLTPEFFRNISLNMPREAKYFLWRVDKKIAAFALCLHFGENFIDYYLGFDYAVSNSYNLYFVRFRDLLNWCIANGVKKYEMGVTGYEAKRRLGFHFTRLYFYIKHRNPVIGRLVSPLSYLFRPDKFDPVFQKMEKG